MKLWLLFLLSTRTIYSKVIIADNPISLRNNIVSREDWINLAKYYVSNHKPYNVKKYVPYRPSSNPIIPGFSSSTAIPEVTTPLFGTSTSLIDLDFESSTRSNQATETTSEVFIDSTTENISTSTQFPETSTMLLSIIGNIPGVETTTRIPNDDAFEETTRQDNFIYTTSEIPLINFSTEAEISTTTLLPDLEITSEASSPDISTITTPETPESTTERIDSTTQTIFNLLDNSSMDELVISTATPELETTTVETESTTIFSISTTETAPSENDTTTIEPAIPESTTDIFNLIISTTSPSFDSSTNVEDSTTEFPVSTTEVQPSTTIEPVTSESTTEKIDSTTQKNLNLSENSRMDEFEMTSTTDRLETTTEERDSTTELTQSVSTTESSSEIDTTTEIGSIETSTTTNDIEKTTEATTTEKITRGAGENANFNGDIIQPKPRKFTYSSDVMPEPYW